MSDENNERDSASGSDSDEIKTEDFSIFDTPPSSAGSSSNNRMDYPGLAEDVNDDDNDAIVPGVEELDSTGSRENVSIVAESIPSTSGGEPSKEYSMEVESLLDVGAVTEIEETCDNSGAVADLEGKRNETSDSTSQERASSETRPRKRSSLGWKTTSSDGSELSPENRPSSAKRYFQPELSKDFPGSSEIESAASYSKTLKEASGISGKNPSTRLETSVQQESVSYGARPKKRSSSDKRTSSSSLSELSPENRPSAPKKYTPELSTDVPGRFPKKSSGSSQSKSTMVDSLNCPQNEELEKSNLSEFKSSFIDLLSEYPESVPYEESGLNTFEDDNNNNFMGSFSERVPHQENKLLTSNNFMIGLLGDFPERVEYTESSLGSLQASVDHSYVSERTTDQEGNLKTKVVKEFSSGSSSSEETPEAEKIDHTSKKSLDVESIVKNILHSRESRPSWSNARRNLAEACPRPRHADRNVLGLEEFRQRFDKEVRRVIDPQTLKALYEVSPEVNTEVEIPSTAGLSSLPPSRRSRGINWSLVFRTATKARHEISSHMLVFNQRNPRLLQLLHNSPNAPTQDVSFPGSSREEVVLTPTRLQEDIDECVHRLINGNSEIARLSIAVFSFLFKCRQEKNFRVRLRNFNTAFHECIQTFCDILTTIERFYTYCFPEDRLYKNLLGVDQACSEIIAQVYKVLILLDEIEAVTKT